MAAADYSRHLRSLPRPRRSRTPALSTGFVVALSLTLVLAGFLPTAAQAATTAAATRVQKSDSSRRHGAKAVKKPRSKRRHHKGADRAALRRVVLLPFEQAPAEHTLGSALPQALDARSLHVVTFKSDGQPLPGQHLDAPAVSAILRGRKAATLVRGVWHEVDALRTVTVLAYAADGRARFVRRYNDTQTAADAAALATTIAADLAQAIPQLGRQAVVAEPLLDNQLAPVATRTSTAPDAPAATVAAVVDSGPEALVETASPSAPAFDLRVSATASVASFATDNLFLTRAAQWDSLVRPAGELQLSFARYWSAGYYGSYNQYIVHPELRSHYHHLYLFANPAWGEERKDEVLVQAAVETLRNEDLFAEINLVRPYLLAKSIFWLGDRCRVISSANAAYRWFYDDQPSSSVDALLAASLACNLPTRTSIEPGVSFGARYYPQMDAAVTRDNFDQYVDAGLHLGQGLWPRAGLQLDYAYHHAFGPSGLLLRKLTLDQFAYLGEEYFFSGHRVRLGLKQVLPWRGWTLGASVDGDQRSYGDLPAFDADGRQRAEDRVDYTVTPRAWVQFQWFDDEESWWWPRGSIGLEYLFTKRWSNSTWFDGARHFAGLTAQLGW